MGHSCGGGFLVRYLSEHRDVQVGKVALVAPWMNPDNYAASDTADFFEFTIDPDFPARTKGVTVFISEDDEPSVVKTVNILRDQVHDLDIRQYSDKGHFTLNDLGTNEFPELLSTLIR